MQQKRRRLRRRRGGSGGGGGGGGGSHDGEGDGGRDGVGLEDDAEGAGGGGDGARVGGGEERAERRDGAGGQHRLHARGRCREAAQRRRLRAATPRPWARVMGALGGWGGGAGRGVQDLIRRGVGWSVLCMVQRADGAFRRSMQHAMKCFGGLGAPLLRRWWRCRPQWP